MRIRSTIVVLILAIYSHGIIAHGESDFFALNVNNEPEEPRLQIKSLFSLLGPIAQQDASPKPGPASSIPTPEGTKSSKPSERSGKLSPEGSINKSDSVDEAPIILTPEEFQEYQILKAQQNQKSQQQLPDFSVNRVELSGVISEGTSEITAEIQVQINRDEAAFKVPLGFNEAILVSFESPESEDQDDHKSMIPGKPDRQKGLQWWFKGKGVHRLTLKLLLDSKTVNAQQNLKLTLPQNTTTRHARLLLPTGKPDSENEYNLITQLPQKIRMERKVLEESGQTEVSFPIPGKDLDFSWRLIEKKTDEEVNLNSDTDIEVEFQYKTVHLKVRQTVEALTGSFQSLEVEIPKGFTTQLVDVPGYLRREQKKEGSLNTLYIELREPVTGPLTFKYELEADVPEDGLLILGDACRVMNSESFSSRETGTVKIRGTQSYQVSHRAEEDNDAIYRTDVSLLKSDVALSHAFRFYKQPFPLSFEVEKIQPKVSIQPRFALNVTPAAAQQDLVQLNLEARINMTVRKGELEEFSLIWPGWEKENWQELSEPTTKFVEEVRPSTENEDELIVKFLEPVSGTLELVLTSKRSAKLNQPEQDLSLPQFSKVAEYRSSILELTGASNLEITPSPKNGTILRRPTQEEFTRPEAGSSSPPLPRERSSLGSLWALEPGPHELQIDIKEMSREILASSELSLTPGREKIMIRQKIDLEVKYVPLEQLSLSIPVELKRTDFEFQDESGQPIPTTASTVSPNENAGLGVTVNFPQQLLGESSFYVVYEQETPAIQAGVSPLQIPYWKLRSPNYDHKRLVVESQELYNIQPNSSSTWDRTTTSISAGQAVWETSQAGNGRIQALISESSNATNQNFYVEQVLVNIQFHKGYNNDQTFQAEVRYQLSGNPTLINFTLPISTMNPEFRWNNELQPLDDLVRSPKGKNKVEYSFRPDESSQVNHEFSISYRGQSSTPSPGDWFHDYRINLPQLEENLAVGNTFLSVTFPNGQHLFKSPEDWSPLFSWQWDGLFFFSRQPYDAAENQKIYQQFQNSLSTGSPYQYDFCRAGNTDELHIQTLSQSVIVLIGAGFSFLSLFFIRHLRFLHNIHSLMFFVLCIAVAGLWYWDTMQLFLQPAIIGILLALFAIGLELWFGRRQSLEYLDLSPSEDFILTPLQSMGTSSQPVSPEGSTAIRTPATASQAVTTIDPGKDV